jgi:hypothetical protein
MPMPKCVRVAAPALLTPIPTTTPVDDPAKEPTDTIKISDKELIKSTRLRLPPRLLKALHLDPTNLPPYLPMPRQPQLNHVRPLTRLNYIDFLAAASSAIKNILLLPLAMPNSLTLVNFPPPLATLPLSPTQLVGNPSKSDVATLIRSTWTLFMATACL